MPIEPIYLDPKKYPYAWMMNVEIHEPLKIDINGTTYNAGSVESIFQSAKILATANDLIKQRDSITGTDEAAIKERELLNSKYQNLMDAFKVLIEMKPELVNPEDPNSLGDNIIDFINAQGNCRFHSLWLHNFKDPKDQHGEVRDRDGNLLPVTLVKDQSFGSTEALGEKGEEYWKLDFMKYLIDLRIRQQPENLAKLLNNPSDMSYVEDLPKDLFWGPEYNAFGKAWDAVIQEIRHELKTTNQIKVRVGLPENITKELGSPASQEFSEQVITRADLENVGLKKDFKSLKTSYQADVPHAKQPTQQEGPTKGP